MAVKYLQKLFMQSGFSKEMKDISEETKKEALLLFMYKIFMNSSSKLNNENKDEKESSKKTLTTDQEELKQLDQIKVKKKLVDYLQVN
jgi:condensin complex subunit 1